MPSAALPDEVVQVFVGDTLEEAMAYAVATLGPDLAVHRARRVRKGVQGLRGKERYEVLAAPGAPPGPGDAVEGAFASLLERAEAAEEPTPVRRTTRPPAPHLPSVVLAAVPAPAAAPPAQVVPAPRPARPAPSPARTASREEQPPPAPRRRPQPQPRRQPAPASPEAAAWGRTALRRLGLPTPVLAALPAREPRSDAAWVAALSRAFAAVVPPADPSADVCVSGTGLAGVKGIVSAARRGMTPGTITYDGRTAPATPTELALAVRAEVLR